jgi:hypothetical protein
VSTGPAVLTPEPRGGATAPAQATPWRPAALRDVAFAVIASRLLVAVTAAVSASSLRVTSSSEAPAGKVVTGISHPFGHGWAAGALDAVFTPLVRWDALWYLEISRSGYEPLGLVAQNPGQRPVFFPLYPLLVEVLGGWTGNGARLVVATLLSLVAFTAGLLIVHRLTTMELGPAAARGAVLIIAFWAGPFFSAPYSESLFLALSAGAFLAARVDRWWLAALLAGAASATRNTGVLLLAPLLVLYLYGPRGGAARPRSAAHAARRWAPRFPVRPDVLWLLIVPAGLVAYCVYLQVEVGDWQAWRTAQETYGRSGLTTPLTTIHLAVTGVYHALFKEGLAGVGGSNLLNFATLLVVVTSAVGAARRLPAAYAIWVVVALAPAFVAPFDGDALRSLPRFASVLFPIAMWLGFELTRRRVLVPAVALSAAVLAATTAAFTIWMPYV